MDYMALLYGSFNCNNHSIDVLVWNVERKNIISEATSNALNEMYSLADAYNQTFERSQFTSNSDEVGYNSYSISSRQDWMNTQSVSAIRR